MLQYRTENIQYSSIEFSDNRPCLDMIDKPPNCLLKILAEQVSLPRGSDGGFISNLYKEFSSHPNFVQCQDRRLRNAEFGIRHYAGIVNYNADGFLEKNKDRQQAGLFGILEGSRRNFFTEICQFSDESTSTTRRKATVGDKFKIQLQKLIDVLQETNAHYIKCIKPNKKKKPRFYDEEMMIDQLRYLGLYEIIRIRREGYGVHYGFGDFVQRFMCLVPSKVLLRDVKEASRYLRNVDNKMFLMD